jgi:hypothetical protein
MEQGRAIGVELRPGGEAMMVSGSYGDLALKRNSASQQLNVLMTR